MIYRDIDLFWRKIMSKCVKHMKNWDIHEQLLPLLAATDTGRLIFALHKCATVVVGSIFICWSLSRGH